MQAKTSYDTIPYISNPFSQTHPDRLATLGHLFGLTPAPVTECRVLELGCAGGGNLIPMAFQIPSSEFVGIDLSLRQVTDARADIKALGLNNIQIEHASILDVDDSWGQFDYIICHGVYSWVPEPVQEKIMAIAAENLTPHGIAFISYNVYPGWHMREMVRHMMRFHSDQFEIPNERIEQSRALIRFLSDSISTDNYYGAMLNMELNLLHTASDSYLFHEHLEEVNQPIYFHQFAERAQQHGLQYLAESDLNTMFTSEFDDDVTETLQRISPDLIRREQYMDFVRNRFFRQTLLCHEQHKIKRKLMPEDLSGLLVASSLTPETSPPNLAPQTSQTFHTQTDRTISSTYPLSKAAFTILREYWPQAIPIKDLVDKAKHKLRNVGISSEELLRHDQLLEDLISCYSEDIIELHTWQAHFTQEINSTPRISDLARHWIQNNRDVVNQRHETVELTEMTKEVAQVLDGNHTLEDIIRKLTQQAVEGVMTIRYNDEPVRDAESIEMLLRDNLPDTLKNLASFALLVN